MGKSPTSFFGGVNMYKAKRLPKIKESFQIVDENDEVLNTIEVVISDLDKFASRFNKAHAKFMMVQNSIDENPSPQAHEEIGNCIIELMRVVFNDDGAERILEAYEGEFIEMFSTIFPFIKAKILPRIKAVSKERKKMLKTLY